MQSCAPAGAAFISPSRPNKTIAGYIHPGHHHRMKFWRCGFWVVVLVLSACQHTARSPEPPLSGGPTPEVSSQGIPETLSKGIKTSLGGVPLVEGDPKSVLLDHKFFLISYDVETRWASWVLYRLTAEELAQTRARRKDRFVVDPIARRLGLPVVSPEDYDGRIYDRGHMAPSDDFVFDQAANDQTFVMTNMLPQKRALNRGSWSRLEKQVRAWACTEKQLRVITGPIKERAPLKMTSGLGVPQRFFKVILDETPPRKALAFVYSQEDGKALPKTQVRTVEAVQKETGLHFFPDLLATERAKIIKEARLDQWKESNCRRK